MQRVFRRLGATAGVLFACLGCSGMGPKEQPNILLLSIDTLRADHLGCYGYARSTSPRIDAFARSATRFSRAFAPTPWTLTSHVEMLTGRHPYLIGVRDKAASIPATVPMLAELLSEAGYETAAFVDSRHRGFVGGERGFARGFDVYRHAPHRKGVAFEYDVKMTVERGLDWIRSREDPTRPFMVFLHTKSVHTVKDQTPRADHRTPPYDVPAADRFRFVSAEDAQLSWNAPALGGGGSYLTAWNRLLMKGQRQPQDFSHLAALNGLYDSAIHYVDESFGALLDALKREALYDSLLIVLTADHGEEFLDHGRFQHGQIYRETLHVPLIVKWPGEDRGRLEHRDVRLADIVPTLLEAADVTVPDAVEGRSLAPTSQTDRALFAFHHEPPEPEPRLRSFAMRDGEWTLVQHESADGKETWAELYRTATDFEQQRPVAGEDERAAAMLAAIEAWRGQSQPQQGEKLELDAETLEHLRALGYLD